MKCPDCGIQGDHAVECSWWNNKVVQAEQHPSVAIGEERDRCASIAADLAQRWERTAHEVRARGTTRFFWIGKPYVSPEAEKTARSIEAAAHGLRCVERLIRDGAQPL